jgi:phage terminase large subunit-like protein
MIESGNVYLPAGADWLDDFLTEVTTFPGAINDDQVDAMSLALDRLIQKTYDVGIRMPDFGVRANPWEANYV